MTIAGTIQINDKGVCDLKKMGGRENKSTLIYWEKYKDTMTMTSYVVNNKSSGKWNMLVLVTTNLILAVTKDDKKSKLAIIKF